MNVSYDEGEWHGVFMNVEDLLDNKAIAIDPAVFLYMYRQTLCSYCRYRLVEKLFKRKMLPQAVLEQCLYDSYDETRAFAARKLKK